MLGHVDELISEMNGTSTLRMATKAGQLSLIREIILDVMFNGGINNPKDIETSINNIPGY